jgi:hypothetical protein
MQKALKALLARTTTHGSKPSSEEGDDITMADAAEPPPA